MLLQRIVKFCPDAACGGRSIYRTSFASEPFGMTVKSPQPTGCLSRAQEDASTDRPCGIARRGQIFEDQRLSRMFVSHGQKLECKIPGI